MVDRRKCPRVNTANLISHVSIDETGRWIFQGMSRALDISRGGILLETAQPITPGCLSMMTVDTYNNLIEIKGELIHCTKSDTAMYHSGIKFIGANEEIAKFVTQMIKVYNHRKNNALIVWSNKRLKESTAVGGFSTNGLSAGQQA